MPLIYIVAQKSRQFILYECQHLFQVHATCCEAVVHLIPGASPTNPCMQIRGSIRLGCHAEADVAPEVNLRNLLHTGNEVCKQGNTSYL